MNFKHIISVIIPVYNGENTIRTAIESVLKQSFSNIELIVIDDGSTDSTLEIINNINDPRLEIFSYPNAGLAASRNRGIEKASGDFISFIDADDLWTPDKLEVQYLALQNHPETSIAYSWTDYIDESGNFIKSGRREKFSGYVYQQMLVSNFLENGSNLLAARKVFQEVGGFDESLNAAEDWDMCLRLSAQYKFVCVEKVQILYRLSLNSMSANLIKQESASLTVINRAFNYHQSIPFQKSKSLSISLLYKYLFFKAIDANLLESVVDRNCSHRLADIHKFNVFIATRYFYTWIINNPSIIFAEKLLVAIATYKLTLIWLSFPIKLFKKNIFNSSR
jgi:glycosyltransferase involved in cell wall biosynthesis